MVRLTNLWHIVCWVLARAGVLSGYIAFETLKADLVNHKEFFRPIVEAVDVLVHIVVKHRFRASRRKPHDCRVEEVGEPPTQQILRQEHLLWKKRICLCCKI